MIDMGATITPKSDQLNADDLIAGPMTIAVTRVTAAPSSADQPVDIHFQGDGSKPYKPCKSMRRVLVAMWGADATRYTGRRMTLYRDPEVAFGGIKVGGIRISHMSHIDGPRTMALTATRASRKPYTVRPLEGDPADTPPRTPNANEPRALPLSTEPSEDEVKAWGRTMRLVIAGAETHGLKVTWVEFNRDALLRVAALSPRLAAWIKEVIPADDSDAADPNADDAATGVDDPAASASPAQAAGAASSATERSQA